MQTNKKPPLVPPDLSSTELQEWQRAAQASHERIVQSLDSVAKARQSVIQTCAKSIGVPQERDINRLIWHGVVRYANTATDAKGAAEAFLAFQGFCTLCLIRLRDPLDMIGIRDASFEDLESRAAAGTLTTFKGFFEACCHRLSTLHRPFEAMLTWLADPNGRSSAQKSQAIEFLVEHGGEGTIELDLSANDNFDDT